MGKNPVQRIGYGNLAGLALIAISVILASSMISFGQGITGTTGASSANSATICNIFNTIKNVIFILGLTLMVLGGAIYAGANLMPSQSRGSFQGYGMAMVVGGIIGVAIAVAAPFILNTVIGASGQSGQVLSSGTTVGGVTIGGSSAISSSICSGTAGGVGGLF
jgi:hypothetical protein